MERTTAGSDSERRRGSGRRHEPDGGSSGATGGGAVAALHGAAGNQAVGAAASDVQRQATASGPGTEATTASRDSADGLCSRCEQRYRAGKPLDCPDCEAALQRSVDPGEAGDGVVQPKLEVSQPDDPAEREAERVADAVMQTVPPEPTRTDGVDDAGREACPECGVERATDRPGDCPTCGAGPGRSVRFAGASSRGAGTDASDDVAAQVRSASTGGRRLPGSVRTFFESRFGRDFSDVRVHTGPGADAAARSVDAAAFTLGSNVVFASGNYRPGTAEGRRLLAHELTHIVQNGVADRSTVRRLPAKTPHGKQYVKGVKHNHEPSGEWSEVQQRANCNLYGEKSVWNTLSGSENAGPVGCVCSWYQPREVLQTAIDQRMGDKPLARRHMKRYMEGGGDLEEDAKSLVLDDPGVRTKLQEEMSKDPRGHFKIEQDEYQNDDFWFSFGAIDRFDYEVERSADQVHVWFADRYEWHPVYKGLYTKKSGDEERATNCVHAAAVELKAGTAADYWMYGYDTVSFDELLAAGSSGPGSGGSGSSSGSDTENGGIGW